MSNDNARSIMEPKDATAPCPFCGANGPAVSVYPRTCNKSTPYNAADRAFPIVRCRSCGAEAAGKDWGEPDTAIAAWNRRASPAQAAEQAISDEQLNAAIEANLRLLDEKARKALTYTRWHDGIDCDYLTVECRGFVAGILLHLAAIASTKKEQPYG